MHTCHDIPIGGSVRLSDIVFVNFFVFEDHLVIIDNYYRVVISPLFVIRCAKYRLLGWFTYLGPCYLVLSIKCVPPSPRNHRTLFSRCSWFLIELVVLLAFLSPTRFGFAVPIGLEYFERGSWVIFIVGVFFFITLITMNRVEVCTSTSTTTTLSNSRIIWLGRLDKSLNIVDT